MMVRRTLTAAAAALVMTVALGGAQAKDWTKIRFATEGAYEPFNFVTPDGKLAGFDVDIGYALCNQMKAECTMVQQDWDGMIPALKARKFDAIIASMSITEERKKQVDFTGKYYQTPARFVAKKDSGLQITKEGLKGKKVGVQRATIHDKFLTDNFGDVVEVVRYGTQDEANTDLINGRLDAILADFGGAQGRPARQARGQGLRLRRTARDRPALVRRGGRHRGPQGGHGPPRQAERRDRRHPQGRHLGQDQAEILRRDGHLGRADELGRGKAPGRCWTFRASAPSSCRGRGST